MVKIESRVDVILTSSNIPDFKLLLDVVILIYHQNHVCLSSMSQPKHFKIHDIILESWQGIYKLYAYDFNQVDPKCRG